MNIFRDQIVRRIRIHALRLGVITALFAVWGISPACGLSRTRTLTQYVRDSWGAEQGFVGGAVYAIAQSSDGYMWLGTERGLVRFDGFEFTLIQTPIPGKGLIGAVRGLLEDAQGDLWIRLDGPRVLRYRNGVFTDVMQRYELSEVTFTAMTRDRRGQVLLWGPRNRSIRFQDGNFRRVVPRDGISGIVISMLESDNGTLWLGARDAGLFRIEDGQFSEILTDTEVGSVNALAPSEDGGVWIGSEAGLKLWEHGGLVKLNLPASLHTAQIFALLLDRNHNLWVGTDNGLYRIDPERKVVTGFLRNTLGTEISAIYEDKEGDVWFAGAHGIERIRDGMFTSIMLPGKPAADNGGPIFVDHAGRAWFAPVTGGLYCLENNAITRVAVPGLGSDVVYSISGGDGELWLGRRQGGLTELTRSGNGWTARTYTQKDGLAQNSVYTVTRARDGSVWAGTVSGGLSVLRHGHFKTYTVDNDLQSNAIFSSLEAADGTMWFASPSGLVSFDGQHWKTYGTPETAPYLNVRTEFEDRDHVLWVGTSHGLARFDHGRIVRLPGMPPALNEEVLGIGQDALGFLWVMTAQHVLQVNRTGLLSGTLNDHDVMSYGAGDGLLETQGVRRDRSLATDSLGRIWLSLPHSLAVADVANAKGYRWPVGVRVDTMAPDDAATSPEPLVPLPPKTRSITFRYSGTNLSMPQRTWYRYMLEGSDQTWSSDTSLRQVVYAHLSPGSYRFRILASNGLGMWNGSESDIPFVIQPALWQTWYFRLLCLLALAIAAGLLYRIRLMQLTEQLNRRFQDRLEERTRIAQDLHDTLLQGVLSASLQLDIAQEWLPTESPAKLVVRRVLELMAQVTEEGRSALRGLRTRDNTMSFDAVLAHLQEDIVQDNSLVYRVNVRGESRLLRAAVRDEVYRIVREAVINGVTHSRAEGIDVKIEYGSRAFRVVVEDDGCGIAAEVLQYGREGHWGLAGMRERAHAIGSELKIYSRVPGCTQVELVVPARIAYADVRHRRYWWFSGR